MLDLFDKLKKLRRFFDGKKTYITAIAVGALAVLQHFGYTVDPWVWKLLGAIGLGSIRAAWKKIGSE